MMKAENRCLPQSQELMTPLIIRGKFPLFSFNFPYPPTLSTYLRAYPPSRAAYNITSNFTCNLNT